MNLEDLIDVALTDGNITDKEREVIRNKAQKEGFDPDEAEIILDAKLQKIRIEQEKGTSRIKKCPNCGEPIPAASLKCPACDFEFQKAKVNSTFQNLSLKLQEAEKQRLRDRKLSSEMFYEHHDKVIDEAKRIANIKCEIINTFPIPNTKDDLIEFITMARGLTSKKLPILDSSFGRFIIAFITFAIILATFCAILFTCIHFKKSDRQCTVFIGIFFITIASAVFAKLGSSENRLEQNLLATAWRAKIKQCMAKARIMIKDPAELARLEDAVKG